MLPTNKSLVISVKLQVHYKNTTDNKLRLKLCQAQVKLSEVFKVKLKLKLTLVKFDLICFDLI